MCQIFVVLWCNGGGGEGWHLSEGVGGSDDNEAGRLPSEYECLGMGRDVKLK